MRLLAVLLVACSGSEPTAPSCEGLDEPTCSATEGCWPIMAKPGPCPWSGEQEYAGCMTGDGGCDDVTSFGAPSPGGDADACWFFAQACIPDGWTREGCPDIGATDTGCI